MSALVICVRMIDGRYHGVGDWPPCPFRLFQALVASAASLGSLGSSQRAVFEWLEGLPAPTIGAPHSQAGQQVSIFVPNNDLDAKGGDIRRIAEVRKATKHIRPHLFFAEVPFVYVWELSSAPEAGIREYLSEIVAGIYQFGRGVDVAYADIEWLDETELNRLAESYSGQWFRPSDGGDGFRLRCQLPGSFASLLRRQEGREARFQYRKKGRTIDVTYRQPPAAHYREIAYESPPKSFLYELRASGDASRFACWPLESAHALVVSVRDAGVERLRSILKERQHEIARFLIGRQPDGSNHAPATDRVRIVPLPSIGHAHADHGIRRILVVVPASCTLRADDLDWAFSGLGIVDKETGEILATLISSRDTDMQRHFGIGKGASARVWRTLTPMALPHDASRRSNSLRRKPGEEKAGVESRSEMERASHAVRQALRMADVSTPVEAICVQREPFERNGQRVEPFASGTRFHAQRLWHVEITFCRSVFGPLAVGDGRFLGLGIMAPALGQHAPRLAAEIV